MIPGGGSDRMGTPPQGAGEEGDRATGAARPGRLRDREQMPMIVGVPKETKADEYRVAMLPVGAEELTAAGHSVLIEAGAGQGSGIADAQYAAAGASLVEGADAIWARADLIVKVK